MCSVPGRRNTFRCANSTQSRKKRVPRADDQKEDGREFRTRPKAVRPGKDGPVRQKHREQHDAKALERDGAAAERRDRNVLVRLEIFLLNIRRIVVHADLRVLDGRDHHHCREKRRKNDRFDPNRTPNHGYSSSLFLQHNDAVGDIADRRNLAEQLVDGHKFRHALAQAVLFDKAEIRQQRGERRAVFTPQLNFALLASMDFSLKRFTTIVHRLDKHRSRGQSAPR